MAFLPEPLRMRALNHAQPLGVYLELTYRCNWRCVFCYNPRHNDIRALRLDEWIEVLDDLRELGTMTVSLTGGEPLAHPAFFEIAAAVRERKFALHLLTNGALIDDAIADRLAALYPSSIELSLHGATPEVHDATTGRAGSFEKVWRAVALLTRRGMRVMVKTPLTRENEHQLDEMIRLAQDTGVEYRIDHNITPRDDGDMTNQVHRASDAAIRRVLKMAQDGGAASKRVAGGVNCGLGRITMAIDPEGNVYPCMQWRHTSLGNVRQMRLRSFWSGSEERIHAATVAVDANTLLLSHQDANVRLQSFCPALALQRGGDPLALDDTFLETTRLYAEAATAVR